MIHKITYLILLLVTLLNAQIRSTDVDKIVYEEMIWQNLPGLAVGVYQKGKIDYTKGYGYIDLNSNKPITDNTVFRWASISKTITAIAALQLIEKESDFSINDKVTEHYPYWTSKIDNKETLDKTKKEKVTIKNLLNNRSGINHYTKGTKGRKNEYKNKSRLKYDTDSDKFNANSAADIFRKAKLDFDPGGKYLYTTYGFNLLGAVIDKKSGSYPNWVRDNIKNKLGMSTLKISDNESYMGFQKKRDGIINEKPIDSKEWVLPGGGWESNIKDLLKFANGILDKKLLKTTANLWKDDGNKVKNKKGKMVSQTYKRGINSLGSNSTLRVWHGGAHGNLRTLMYIMPNKDIAVVVMIPAEYGDTWNIVRRIVDKMGIDRKKSINIGPKDKCTKVMGSSGKKFIGVWRKTNKDVVIRTGYNTVNFNKEWNFLKSQGYQVFDIEASKHKGKLVWDGIFKEAGSGYGMFRNYDYNGFKKKWDEMRRKGFRLFNLEAYTSNNKKKWAGLFIKASGSNGIWRNFSTADFAKKRKEMAKQGKKLIDIEVMSVNGQQKWSGVWITGKDGLLNRNYDRKDFYELNDRRNKKGYKLLDVEVYKVNGKEKWAGIWEKDPNTSQFKRLSYCDFMKTHHDYSSKGYELIDLESY